MQKALLIAEKPSQAALIKEAYRHYPNPQYEITYCAGAGHLLELYMPEKYHAEWKDWNLDVLPMIPEKFKKSVITQKKLRFENIKKEIKSGKYDVIINAGDPAREGELIVTEILMQLNCKIPEVRLWTDDLTVNGICKGFDNLLKPQTNLKKAAMLREWDDWLHGINGSRTVSLATGCKISVGRVMTAALAMIVIRDQARESFVPTTYYECEMSITAGDDSFTGKVLKDHNNAKFDSKDEIIELLNRASNSGKVVNVKRESKATEPPLLLNLAELQKEAFSEYGMPPDFVLKLAQSLYEKKLLSYPRTDCRYLSESVANELADNLRALSTIPTYSEDISRILNDVALMAKICKHKNKFVDNSKLTDHHALITTQVRADMNTLSEDERKIYYLVSRRVMAMFMPDRVVNKTQIICQFGAVTTISEGRSVSNLGYSKYITVNTKDKMLPDLNEEDDVYCDNVALVQKATKPPAYYNYKTLIEDMENCGKFAENKDNASSLKKAKGLGQSSTRDSIIKKLVKLQYIKEVGKGNKSHLESTPSGRYIVEILKHTDLVSVDMTAVMEQKLLDVQNGTYDANQYYIEMIADVKHITEQLKQLPKADSSNPLWNGKKSVNTNMTCPKCGRDIYVSDKLYYCIGLKDQSCDFRMNRNWYGATIEPIEFSVMLAGNRITKRFTWDSGKSSDASLGIVDLQYKFFF